MNRVFLAQVGGSIPPARVPPSKSQPPPPPDNNGSFATRLFGLFGWKSAPQTQIASADLTTLERGAHPPATGSILATKTKLAPQRYTVASATPDEPYTNDSLKNDIPVAAVPGVSAAAGSRFRPSEHGTDRVRRLSRKPLERIAKG